MKNGKLYAILIGAVFVTVTLLSLFFLFSVKEVKTVCGVYGGADAENVQSSLDALLGKNMFFVSTKDVEEAVKEHTKYKVVSVEKAFPNVLNVEVAERREVYRLSVGGALYSLDETGFVLGTSAGEAKEREIISLSLEGIEILSAEVGGQIKTSDDGLFYSVLSMAESVNLTDCIKSANIVVNDAEIKEARFSTYTGVEIVVDKPEKRGGDKIKKAFEVYDGGTKDFYKTFAYILVLEKDGGEITATWTRYLAENGE